MDMKKVGRVLNGVIGRKGFNPLAYTISNAEREKWADAVNDALRVAYGAAKWPQLRRFELRQFRPDWDADTAYTAGQGVLHGEAYYDAAADNRGVEPGTDGAVWDEPAEMAMFVQLEQPWEPVKMDRNGVDLHSFAYLNDPRLHPDTPPVAGCRFWMDSVVLPRVEQLKVWCGFVPKRESFDLTEWADGDYERDDVCYRTLTGECYRALDDVEAGAGAPEASELWLRIRIPEFFARYVAMCVLSAEMSEEAGRHRAMTDAEAELERVVCDEIDGSGEQQICVNVGR